MGTLDFAPPGPFFDVECTRVQSGWSAGCPRVFGVLMSQCASNLASGNIFLFCPLGWDHCCFFSAFVFASGLDGLMGEAGGRRGFFELGPTKEVPSLRYEDRVRDTTSSRVEEPLMMGLPLPTR